jgi:hypothetical protein
MVFGINRQKRFEEWLMENGSDVRFSDFAAGASKLALELKYITRPQAYHYVAVFNSDGNFVTIRKHEGDPFLGPDGKPMRIGKELMNSGNEKLGESDCRMETLHEHPKYEQWLKKTLYHRRPSDASTTTSEDSSATKNFSTS